MVNREATLSRARLDRCFLGIFVLRAASVSNDSNDYPISCSDIGIDPTNCKRVSRSNVLYIEMFGDVALDKMLTRF